MAAVQSPHGFSLEIMRPLRDRMTPWDHAETAFADLRSLKPPNASRFRKASDRLACYDKAAPPASKAKPAAATSAPRSQLGQAVDRLAVENARLDAKIKNICRVC